MNFSGATFLFLFLPLTIIAYFLTGKKYRNLTLLIAGLLFYIWAEPIFVFLLLFLILTDYFAGLSLEKWQNRRWVQTLIVTFVVLVHISVLCLFKYQPLFLEMVADIFQEETPILEFVVPLGISIYTLQGLSYVLDLYWNKIKVQKNFVNLAMYISFFPLMVVGPVLRYSDLGHSFVSRTITPTTIAKGYSIFIRGLAKKVLLANSLFYAWEQIHFAEHESAVATAWLGLICFAYAIYFYFSGYSDMARGIGKILGFDIPNNFNYPYISKSVTEFWRRSNISLTVWLKTYIFSHIGVRSSSFTLALIKLIGLWGLIGLWYGGEVNFLLWGIYFGIIIVLEQLFFASILEKASQLLQRLYTFVIVLIGWVIFTSDSLTEMTSYVASLFTGTLVNDTSFYFLHSFGLLLLLAIFAADRFPHYLLIKFENRAPKIMFWLNTVWEIFLSVLCVLFVISGIPEQQNFLIAL